MTEDEAKTKWCPMVRFTPETEHSRLMTNRYNPITNSTSYNPALCVGSACMGRRWVREPDPADDHPFGEKFVEIRGYCGAFGRPTS